MHLRAQGDQVRELRDRLEVAELGQPRESERVQLVALEQARVRVVEPAAGGSP